MEMPEGWKKASSQCKFASEFKVNPQFNFEMMVFEQPELIRILDLLKEMAERLELLEGNTEWSEMSYEERCRLLKEKSPLDKFKAWK